MRKDDPHEKHSQATALMRGAGVNLVGFVAKIVFLSLHSLLTARLYGAQAYGTYAIGVAAVNLLSSVGQAGMGRTLTRFVAIYQAEDKPGLVGRVLKSALYIAIPISCVIGIALSLFAEQMAEWFGEPALSSSFPILGLAVPALTLATLLVAFTQGLKLMRYKALAQDIVRPGIELLALVVLSWIGVGSTGLPIAYTLSLVSIGVLLILLYRARLSPRGLVKDHLTSCKASLQMSSVLKFAAPILAVNVLMSVTSRVSVFMLSIMGTSAEVGVFGVLQRLVILGMTFLIATNLMFGPMIADLVQRRRLAELSHLYKVSTRWVLVVSLPIFLILLFFSSEVLHTFGEEFATGSLALRYLVIGAIFNVATGSSGIILMMSGRPHYSAINEIIMLIIVVGLNLLLIPTYGLLGAVWAVAVGTPIVNTLRVIQVWWHLRIHPGSRSLLKTALAGTIMGIVLWAWKTFFLKGTLEWYWVGLGGGLALLSYGITLVAMGLERDETEVLGMLKGYLPRIQRLRS